MGMARKTLIYMMITLLLLSDYFVIEECMSVALAGMGPLVLFVNVTLIGFLNVVPVFVVAPTISEMIGTSIKSANPEEHRVKMMTAVVGLILFVAAFVMYFILSITYSQRFMLANNSFVISILFGIWPLLTTLEMFILVISENSKKLAGEKDRSN
ncbi:MAG: hypothetical protein LBC41_10800 [Clostridiales bacterium]|jgi:small-conductance mechanosensitive channel|nr:hypothetical protein [Clostridiales bacterium]